MAKGRKREENGYEMGRLGESAHHFLGRSGTSKIHALTSSNGRLMVR